MDSDKKLEHPNKGDFLMLIFEKGIHEVLEKIFLGLGLETVRMVKKVSQEWRGMLEFYLHNNIPRIRKIVTRCMSVDSKVSIFSQLFLFFQTVMYLLLLFWSTWRIVTSKNKNKSKCIALKLNWSICPIHVTDPNELKVFLESI